MDRTAFFGTPAAAIPTLEVLHRLTAISVVVTRPDKPRGRSGTPQPSDVKEAAEAMGLEVLTPVRASEITDRLEGLDLAVVVAYGQILPAEMLAIPRHGFVNVHFSRLPRWRGAAPVARAILAGDQETGVDIIALDAGMDTGPLLARQLEAITPTDTTGTLTARLAERGGALLETTLPELLEGSITPLPQADEGVSLAPKLTSAEAHLRPHEEPAVVLERRVRAFNPKPGAWGLVDGHRLKVWAARAVDVASPSPGHLEVAEGRPFLGTRDGALELAEVQPAGKSPMAGDVWVRGQRGQLVWE